MKKTVFGFLCASIATLSMSSSFALNQKLNCPVFSAGEMRAIIYVAKIESDGFTLADASGRTPDQVIAEEPTANPFDTYHNIKFIKYVNNVPYVIYIGNVLGKDPTEARTRAEKIMVGSEQEYKGTAHNDYICIYKSVEASPNVPNYPYKSSYESVSLIAVNADKLPNESLHNLHKLK